MIGFFFLRSVAVFFTSDAFWEALAAAYHPVDHQPLAPFFPHSLARGPSVSSRINLVVVRRLPVKGSARDLQSRLNCARRLSDVTGVLPTLERERERERERPSLSGGSPFLVSRIRDGPMVISDAFGGPVLAGAVEPAALSATCSIRFRFPRFMAFRCDRWPTSDWTWTKSEGETWVLSHRVEFSVNQRRLTVRAIWRNGNRRQWPDTASS